MNYIIDIGPKAGINGGEVIFAGVPNELYKHDSLTSQYLKGKLSVSINNYKGNKEYKFIEINGINKYNLKNIDIKIPLNTITLITGMSGSGKSTLVKEVKPAIEHHLQSVKINNKNYTTINIPSDNLKKIEFINQNPIGRSSRSNPITYIKAYDDIENYLQINP